MTPDQEAKLLENVTTILANCTHCRERLSEHHVTLYGNGNPGLRQEVTQLKEVTSGLKNEVEKNSAWYRDKMGIVIIGLLGIVAAFSGAKQVTSWLTPTVVQQEAVGDK
jgi:hypothetical protein